MAYDPCGKQISPLSKYCPDCGNRDAKVPRPAVPRADAAETRFRILHPNPMTRQQGAGVPSWFAQRERTWRSRLIPSLIRAALAAAIWFFFFY